MSMRENFTFFSNVTGGLLLDAATSKKDRSCNIIQFLDYVFHLCIKFVKIC